MYCQDQNPMFQVNEQWKWASKPGWLRGYDYIGSKLLLLLLLRVIPRWRHVVPVLVTTALSAVNHRHFAVTISDDRHLFTLI